MCCTEAEPGTFTLYNTYYAPYNPVLVTFSATSSAEGCAALCSANPPCRYFTRNKADGSCLLKEEWGIGGYPGWPNSEYTDGVESGCIGNGDNSECLSH